MSIKKIVNEWRRKISKRLVKDVGADFINPPAGPEGNAEIKRILISRPNHRLGNQLLLAPLIAELEETFPNCKIDLFVRGGLSNVIFKNYPSINKVIKLPKRPTKEPRVHFAAWREVKSTPYDLAINAIHGSSSGRVSVKKSNAKYKLFGLLTDEVIEHHEDYLHMAKSPVYITRDALQKIGFKSQQESVKPMDIRLDAAEVKHGKTELDKLVSPERKTIGIFTFATGSKCYSPEWWNPVYETLKSRFPEYNIVEVLPAENVSQINFAAPSFYSHDVREIAALIAATEVFIAADSGIMHLAAASGTPTIGLFSVTDPTRYGPYGNGSVAVNTNVTNATTLADIIESALKKGK